MHCSLLNTLYITEFMVVKDHLSLQSKVDPAPPNEACLMKVVLFSYPTV